MRKKNKFNKNNVIATEVNDEEDKKKDFSNYYDYDNDYNKPKSK